MSIKHYLWFWNYYITSMINHYFFHIIPSPSNLLFEPIITDS